MRVILASSSPRRRQLLRTLVPSFEVIKSSVDESLIEEQNPVKFALMASQLKAESVASKVEQGLIISADTVVFLNDSIIGKPRNEKDAYHILSHLSGTEHRVITAIFIIVKNNKILKKLSDYGETIVKMKELREEDIITYLSSSNWKDKAGAYAIQEHGDRFIEYIIGDYHNVVGLPLKKLRRLLERLIASKMIVLSQMRDLNNH